MAEARPGRAEGVGASENKTSEVGVPKAGGFRKGIPELVSEVVRFGFRTRLRSWLQKFICPASRDTDASIILLGQNEDN